MNESMYSLSDKYFRLLNMAAYGFDHDTGEVYPESEKIDPDITNKVFDEAFQAIQDSIENKVIGTAHVIRRLEADADNVEKEIRRLKAIVKHFNSVSETLRDKLREFMRITETPKVKTTTLSVSLGKPSVSVVVDDVQALPIEFQRITVTADKVQVKRYLDAEKTTSIAGAHLEEGKPRLTIR